MANLVVWDRVKDTTSTTGTGTITLDNSPPTGYQNFSIIGNGNYTYYTIDDGAGNWEVGKGTYTSTGTTLSRSVISSSAGGSLVNFGAGSKTVFCTDLARYIGPFFYRENAVSPNASVPLASFQAAGNATNMDAVFAAKGSGATLAQEPDSGTTGGNKRGTYATDWQKYRGSSSQIAYGAWSTIAGGRNNSSTSQYSFTAGYANTTTGNYAVAIGYTNAASGNTAFAANGNNTASGGYSAAFGRYSVAQAEYSTVVGGWGHSRSREQSLSVGGYNTTYGGNGPNNTTVHNLAASSYADSDSNNFTSYGSVGFRYPSFGVATYRVQVVGQASGGTYSGHVCAMEVVFTVYSDGSSTYAILGAPAVSILGYSNAAFSNATASVTLSGTSIVFTVNAGNSGFQTVVWSAGAVITETSQTTGSY